MAELPYDVVPLIAQHLVVCTGMAQVSRAFYKLTVEHLEAAVRDSQRVRGIFAIAVNCRGLSLDVAEMDRIGTWPVFIFYP